MGILHREGGVSMILFLLAEVYYGCWVDVSLDGARVDVECCGECQRHGPNFEYILQLLVMRFIDIIDVC